MTIPSLIAHLVDVHCHPTDTPVSDEDMAALPFRICAMATRSDDQDQVAQLAKKWPQKVIPCFGFHPWFTHKISLLDPPPPKLEHYASLFIPNVALENAMEQPDFAQLFPSLSDPVPLSTITASIRSHMEMLPNAMLGEVGIDRAFRIPFIPYGEAHDHSDSTGKRLSPYTVPLDHQLAVLEAQISLAVELGRNISLHSVKAQQATFELLKRLRDKHGRAWSKISLDLHSCGFSVETWLDVEKNHSNVYLSLSTAINFRSPAHEALIRACSSDRLLVESDYPMVSHTAKRTWDMVLIISRLKNWPIERSDDDVVNFSGDSESRGVVKRLSDNWEAFATGEHQPYKPKESGKIRKRNKFPHAEDDWRSDHSDDVGTMVYG